MSLGLRKNDAVIVMAGAEKGKKGKILRVERDKLRAYIEGVKVVKRFVRKSRKNPQGGQVQQEAPIPFSLLALFCSRCGKGVRFAVKVLTDGSKSRVCSKCESVLGQE